MDTKLPAVTVVIPNHNYGHWVKDAITSVLIQDYPNKRIVFVDDNSKDDSIQNVVSMYTKASKHKEQDVYTGIIQNIPMLVIGLKKDGEQGFGPSKARNEGIKAAWNDTHIYIFLDSDDYWEQGKISKSVSKIIEAPEKIGVVYTDNYGLNISTGNMIREYRPSFDRKVLLRNCFVHSGSAVTKLAFNVCGLYDESMRTAEDWDLWIRIAKEFMIYHIPEPLVIARHGSYNSTNSVEPKIWQQNWAKISKRISEVYGQK